MQKETIDNFNQPVTEKYTVVYDAESNEIERLDGIVAINPKDYERQLPITYRHIAITTELLSVIRIDKK